MKSYCITSITEVDFEDLSNSKELDGINTVSLKIQKIEISSGFPESQIILKGKDFYNDLYFLRIISGEYKYVFSIDRDTIPNELDCNLLGVYFPLEIREKAVSYLATAILNDEED